MTTVTCPFTCDQADRDRPDRHHPDRHHPDWCDPFPEPRALPGGWDLAGLPRYEHLPSLGRGFSAAVPGALAAELIERRPDPFPECNTFPSGWDLADVLALERERMQTQVSESEQVNFLLPLSVDAFA